MRYVHLFLSLIFLLTASGEFLRHAAWRPVHPVWREPLESSSIFDISGDRRTADSFSSASPAQMSRLVPIFLVQ